MMSENLILVVDDDPDIRTMLVELLRYHGYTVRTASNGVEGLKAIERYAPRLVILDQWMPALNGAGFARELARRQLNIPVLVMTAAPNPAQLARELGAVGFVQKPFELVDLLEAVGRHCAALSVAARAGRGVSDAHPRPRPPGEPVPQTEPPSPYAAQMVEPPSTGF